MYGKLQEEYWNECSTAQDETCHGKSTWVLKCVNYKIIGVVIRNNNKKHIIKEIIFGENYLTATRKSKNSVALKFINDWRFLIFLKSTACGKILSIKDIWWNSKYALLLEKRWNIILTKFEILCYYILTILFVNVIAIGK